MLNLTRARLGRPSLRIDLSMNPDPRTKQLFRFTLALLIGAALLLALSAQAALAYPDEAALQSTRRGCCGPIIIVTPTRRARNIIPRLCGKLAFLTDYETGIQKLAILPCDGGMPYLLKTHPRDIIPYYQFRNAVVARASQLLSEQLRVKNKLARETTEAGGDPDIVLPNEYVGVLCTVEYGCVDRYITTYDNYVGINACDECGLYNRPPTWTSVPLFSYTPTASQAPTSTATPLTPSPTRTPTVLTPTQPLSEVLFGTPLPTATATLIPTRTWTPITLPTQGGASANPCTGGLGVILFASGLAALVLGLRLRQGL
ncbi:MAG: hypothetical protein JXA78_17135 [Anaerolineales bacterium]|nr:hypothetical protein [Anaerolineales bacterium]